MLTQYAAYGQNGLGFFSEDHNVEDSAREDIQCHILGSPLEPSEIKVKEIKPSPASPDGINKNKEALSKPSLIIFWTLQLTLVLLVICSGNCVKYLVLQQSTSVYSL